MDELKKGIKHENEEHKDITKGDEKIAKKIVASHLKEDPHYYSHLTMMEAAVKNNALKGALKRLK